MKRGLLAVFLLLGFGFLSAQGLGLSLDTSAYLSQTSQLAGEASESLGLSLVIPFGSAVKLTTRASASVSYAYDGETGEFSPDYPMALGDIDFSELSLSFNGPVENEKINRLSFSMGRLPYTDPTGVIYAYRVDGLILSASYPAATMRAILGYTGFLPSSATIIPSAADTAYPSPFADYGDFAPPRALAAFSIRSPKIAGHDLYLAITAQEDLRDRTQLVPEFETIYDTVSSGSASSAYAALGLSGAPGPSLSYSGFGILGLGQRLSYVEYLDSPTGYRYEFAKSRAWCVGAQARLVLSPRLTMELRVLSGSGDSDAANATDGNTAGDSTQFVPITSLSTGLVFSPLPGNVTTALLGLSYKPYPSYRLGPLSVVGGSKTYAFIKNGEGPVSEAGIMPDAKACVLGIEEDLSLIVQLLSDVSLTAAAGLYLPLPGAYDASYIEANPLEYTIRASLSVAL